MSDHLAGLHRLPEHMRSAVCMWIEQGIRPGDFLSAVLQNDLFEAFGRADETNTVAMRDWVMYLYNDSPSECFGSPEKFLAWAKRGGLYGCKIVQVPEPVDDDGSIVAIYGCPAPARDEWKI